MECKKCGKPIPATIIIDGKKRNLCNRKFCLECSPFGSMNRSKYGPGFKQDKENVCRVCGKIFTANRTLKVCPVCNVKIARYKMKQKAVNFMGGKCMICGWTGDQAAFEFHHINPEEKDFQISSKSYKKWNEIVAELNKCIMVCSNCHQILGADRSKAFMKEIL